MKKLVEKLICAGIKKAVKSKRPFCSAVVAAAGSSVRMGGENKLFSIIDGEPLLLHTLRALNGCECIDEIVVVAKQEDMPNVADICKSLGSLKLTKVVKGGQTRMQSVMNGLESISEKAELVAVHDGARPFITNDIVENTAALAKEFGASAPCIKIKDTVKFEENGVSNGTVEREKLRAVQTPQIFQTDILKAALSKALKDGAELTDDCSAVERLGMKIHFSEGSEQNIKITTPFDLNVASVIAAERRYS